jgi:hypothetical protein
MRIFNVDRIALADAAALHALLLPGEEIAAAFRSPGTDILFTSRRIVTSQLQVLLTERLETTSFSYRSLSHFALVQGAPEEARSELKIWLSGEPHPLHLRANPGSDLADAHRLLAERLP